MYTRSTLSIAAAFLISSAVAAGASDITTDDYAGSVKDNAIESIPVPGAIEIPETMSWYIRGDYGYGFNSKSDVTGDNSSEPGDLNSYSFGFGRYISPNFRADLTFDYRNDDQVLSVDGRFTETLSVIGTLTRADPVTGTPIELQDALTVNLVMDGRDVVTFQNHTALANVYYDISAFGSFKPYIGGGLGISIYQLERERNASFVRCDAFASDGAGLVNCPLEQSVLDSASESRTETSTAVGLAASLTAGVAMELGDSLHADLNYRYTWHGGDVATTSAFGGSGGNSVEVGDRSDHEIRFGLRYDIW